MCVMFFWICTSCVRILIKPEGCYVVAALLRCRSAKLNQRSFYKTFKKHSNDLGHILLLNKQQGAIKRSLRGNEVLKEKKWI